MNTRVANMAARHLGNSNEIANLETERSQEARAMRAFYQISLDDTLRDCALPVTRRRRVLSVVEMNPTTDYLYSYRVPTESVGIRGVALPRPASYYANGLSLPLYQMTSDDSGQLILSNVPNLEIEYIHRIENTEILPADFVMAWSYKLAFLAAPSISGGDRFKMQNTTNAAYELWVGKAKKNGYNEEPGWSAPPSEFVNAHYYDYVDGGYPISGRTF